MKKLVFILAFLPAVALADSRIVPDGFGGYHVIEEPRTQVRSRSNVNGQIMDFASQPSPMQQHRSRRMQKEQLRQLQIQNELLRRQLGR